MIWVAVVAGRWCINVDWIIMVWGGGGGCVVSNSGLMVYVAGSCGVWWYVFWLAVLVVYKCGCDSSGVWVVALVVVVLSIVLVVMVVVW